jgi:hypothetical protein
MSEVKDAILLLKHVDWVPPSNVLLYSSIAWGPPSNDQILYLKGVPLQLVL